MSPLLCDAIPPALARPKLPRLAILLILKDVNGASMPTIIIIEPGGYLNCPQYGGKALILIRAIQSSILAKQP